MADTGAPWNLPYPLPTDLVRDGADAIKDLAEATADSLKIVAVKQVLKTDPFFASAIASQGNAEISGLSISHETADAANLVLITVSLGAVSSSDANGRVGFGVHDGTDFIAVGDVAGDRTRVTGGGRFAGVDDAVSVQTMTVPYVPGSGSKTYNVRVINYGGGVRDVAVNRRAADADGTATQRTVSSLIIQEVKV